MQPARCLAPSMRLAAEASDRARSAGESKATPRLDPREVTAFERRREAPTARWAAAGITPRPGLGGSGREQGKAPRTGGSGCFRCTETSHSGDGGI